MINFLYQFIFLLSLIYYLLYLRNISDLSFYILVIIFSLILYHYASNLTLNESFSEQTDLHSTIRSLHKLIINKVLIFKQNWKGCLQKGDNFLSSLKQKWISS